MLTIDGIKIPGTLRHQPAQRTIVLVPGSTRHTGIVLILGWIPHQSFANGTKQSLALPHTRRLKTANTREVFVTESGDSIERTVIFWHAGRVRNIKCQRPTTNRVNVRQGSQAVLVKEKLNLCRTMDTGKILVPKIVAKFRGHGAAQYTDTKTEKKTKANMKGERGQHAQNYRTMSKGSLNSIMQ